MELRASVYDLLSLSLLYNITYSIVHSNETIMEYIV